MFSQLWRRMTGGDRTAHARNAGTPEAAHAADAEAPARAAAPAPRVADAASLQRSLDWRAQVLLEGAPAGLARTDAPELVAALRTAHDTVIRQVPLAAQRALAAARDPETPLARITSLFEADPSLAQSLLRQANSAWYRREGPPCTSLAAAVPRVGLKGVQSVLMSSMVEQLLCRPGGAFDAYAQKVWSHMQRTAPIARAIAPAFGADPETAYSLALLHDAGKLVVFDHLSRLRHDHRRELRVPEPFFRKLLLHLHEPIGGLAALRWDLGPEAAHAIAEHHRRGHDPGRDPLAECLHVAERVELAHTNFAPLDWDAIAREGAVTADLGDVQERLQRLEE